MNGLALALVLAFVLVASVLAVQLLRLLRHGSRFRRESRGSSDVERSVASSAIGSEPFCCYGVPPPSKELVLYHLFCKSRSLVDPASGVAPAFAVAASPLGLPNPPPPSPPPPPPPVEEEEEHGQGEEGLLRSHRSRLKHPTEADRELAPAVVVDRADVALQDRERATESPPASEAEVMDTEDEEDNATLFSSASASPFYNTPTSSPTRQAVDV